MMSAFVTALLVFAPDTTMRIWLDWSQVDDAIIARCQLEGLQSLWLQTLLDADLAVVGVGVGVNAGEDASIRVRSEPDAMYLTALVGTETQEVSERLPSVCDSTFQLVLTQRLRELSLWVQERWEARPRPAEPRPQITLAALAGLVVMGPVPARLELQAIHELSRHLQLQLGVGTNLWTNGTLVVLEPSLSAQLTRSWSWEGFRVGAGPRAALLVHAFLLDGVTGGHLDGTLGLSARLARENNPWFVEVGAFMHVLGVRHVVAFEDAYRTTALGVELKVGYELATLVL